MRNVLVLSEILCPVLDCDFDMLLLDDFVQSVDGVDVGQLRLFCIVNGLQLLGTCAEVIRCEKTTRAMLSFKRMACNRYV